MLLAKVFNLYMTIYCKIIQTSQSGAELGMHPDCVKRPVKLNAKNVVTKKKKKIRKSITRHYAFVLSFVRPGWKPC